MEHIVDVMNVAELVLKEEMQIITIVMNVLKMQMEIIYITSFIIKLVNVYPKVKNQKMYS